ncbi:myo-inositol-1(or 4)-monophosphatase [Amycolatopsis xylanica]|uniref:Inositol-1-monophosphatase n=1 Tax=Amycolatopsis xylanica TaxID=589385 RepID=A0A1H3IWF9_9PSEU|nr:inositol monophosphatase family protein [Amycolatopsis xylanica]SDY32050.1 myo-inositol-1(or 4)-monophosphatase [Amycolatopsis xylanica]
MSAVGVDERALKDIAELVAGDAAQLVLRAWKGIQEGRSVEVGTKSADTDVVTAVDHESERFVRARLAELRPSDAVLGEEAGGAAGDGVTWVIDPIDGTVNFLYGLPWFAVSLAAQVGGVSVAGAVVEPVSGRRWTAARGHGSFLDGRRLSVSGPARLDLTLLGTGFAYRQERRVRQARFAAGMLGRVRDIRRPGAASLELCSVAAGWTDAYIEHGLGRWDWAAGALVASEAGAFVSLPGEDVALGADATYAAAPSIAPALREAMIEAGAGSV